MHFGLPFIHNHKKFARHAFCYCLPEESVALVIRSRIFSIR